MTADSWPPLPIDDLRVEDVADVARGHRPVQVGCEALDRVAKGRAHVAALAGSDLPAYGVSTGFGALATVSIPRDRRAALQASLTRSHAAGVGALVESETVRAMMLLRLRTLCSGHTGVRPEVVRALAGLLNCGLVPAVPEHGSLGCSGDLAPLAHVALALRGEGRIRDRTGTGRPAASALAEAGLAPVELVEKEGLALVNGTDGMLGMLCLAIADLTGLLRVADVTAAMSVEALRGTDRAFAADLIAM
ncbi:MAG: aromatic amino acid lyase, partial [Candidatus Nanopelagicales bacterium]